MFFISALIVFKGIKYFNFNFIDQCIFMATNRRLTYNHDKVVDHQSRFPPKFFSRYSPRQGASNRANYKNTRWKKESLLIISCLHNCFEIEAIAEIVCNHIITKPRSFFTSNLQIRCIRAVFYLWKNHGRHCVAASVCKQC